MTLHDNARVNKTSAGTASLRRNPNAVALTVWPVETDVAESLTGARQTCSGFAHRYERRHEVRQTPTRRAAHDHYAPGNGVLAHTTSPDDYTTAGGAGTLRSWRATDEFWVSPWCGLSCRGGLLGRLRLLLVGSVGLGVRG